MRVIGCHCVEPGHARFVEPARYPPHAGVRAATDNLIDVTETWRLPTSPDADDGRYVLQLAAKVRALGGRPDRVRVNPARVNAARKIWFRMAWFRMCVT